MLVIYYQQAWQFGQDHRGAGERLRWAAQSEALANAICHHMLCANNPKAFDHWDARQSEALHLIQALLVSLQSEIDCLKTRRVAARAQPTAHGDSPLCVRSYPT